MKIVDATKHDHATQRKTALNCSNPKAHAIRLSGRELEVFQDVYIQSDRRPRRTDFFFVYLSLADIPRTCECAIEIELMSSVITQISNLNKIDLLDL